MIKCDKYVGNHSKNLNDVPSTPLDTITLNSDHEITLKPTLYWVVFAYLI